MVYAKTRIPDENPWDLLIEASRPDQLLMKKEKIICLLEDFAVSTDHRVKNKIKRKDRQSFGFYQRVEEVVEHESDEDTYGNWCTWNGLQKLREKESWGTRNQRKKRDYPDYSIFEID